MTTQYRIASSTNRDLPSCDYRGVTTRDGKWHGGKVVRSNLGEVHECRFINGPINRLGWTVAVDADVCRKCATPLRISSDGSVEKVDSIQEQVEYLLITPIINALSEGDTKKYLGMPRVKIIQEALKEGIDRETILKRLVEACRQRGFDPEEAYRVADEAGLLDDSDNGDVQRSGQPRDRAPSDAVDDRPLEGRRSTPDRG